MAASLSLRDTNGRWAFEIREGKPAVLGRAENADLRIPDYSVARLHARVCHSQGDGQWYIEDLGARNGVFVNDCRVSDKLAFHVGDLLRIGEVELEVALPREVKGG